MSNCGSCHLSAILCNIMQRVAVRIVFIKKFGEEILMSNVLLLSEPGRCGASPRTVMGPPGIYPARDFPALVRPFQRSRSCSSARLSAIQRPEDVVQHGRRDEEVQNHPLLPYPVAVGERPER